MTKITLEPGVVKEIPIGKLVPDAGQPRETFREKPLEDLAANIKARGVQQPLTVLPSGAHQFMIVHGERRWRASKLAKLKTVPCILSSAAGDTSDLVLDQVSENELREPLNAMERARALGRLADAGKGPTEIVEILGRHGISMSRPAVSNTLRLLKLPETLQASVASGILKESYARDLLQYERWPKVLERIAKAIRKVKTADTISTYWIAREIGDSLSHHGVRLGSSDTCTKACECRVSVKHPWGSKAHYCMNRQALEERREKAAERRARKEATAKAAARPKAPETDPTKVKPVKVTPNDAGVVPLARRSYDASRRLDRASFDTSLQCEGCPHKHLADYSGHKETAADYCLYPPCFDNLDRRQGKINRRNDRIREIIDDQLTPVLIEKCREEPLAAALVLPLLAYVAAGYPVDERPEGGRHGFVATEGPSQWDASGRSSRSSLRRLPAALGRGTLTKMLDPELGAADCSRIVEGVVRSLNLEQRRELALYLSMEIGSFFRISEDYARLFTKPEIKQLVEGYDPPDVPAAQWRERFAAEVKTPQLVLEIWTSPIENIHTPEIDADELDRCGDCGCSEISPCESDDGPCGWAEPPGEDGVGLCTECAGTTPATSHRSAPKLPKSRAAREDVA